MIILGIDPGYSRLGYAVFEKSKKGEKLLEYSCVETSSKKEKGERILELAKNTERIIKDYRPDILSIEKIFFNKNQKTAMEVAEIKGIIIYIALKNGIRIKEFSPLEVKTAVCGYGRADKEQVKKMVCLTLKLKENIKLDDTSDAIALALACLGSKNFIHNLD